MTNRTFSIAAIISMLSVASMASAHSYNSTKSLQDFARNDEGALARFESHFGMNRDEVIDYIGQLHLGKLVKKGTFAICKPAFGAVENQVTVELPRGEAVFMDKSNTPVLLADGAYPMAETFSANVKEGPSDSIVPNAATATPATATAPTKMAMMAQGASTASGAPNTQWLTAIPVLIPLIGMTNDGNGNGGGGTINPVPEPASFAILGVGALGLLSRRKKKA